MNTIEQVACGETKSHSWEVIADGNRYTSVKYTENRSSVTFGHPSKDEAILNATMPMEE